MNVPELFIFLVGLFVTALTVAAVLLVGRREVEELPPPYNGAPEPADKERTHDRQ